MGNGRRTITIGAAAAVALLSFGAGVYFAVYYGSAPKLESGVAKAVETTAPIKGRADTTPPPDSVELSETQLKLVNVAAVEEREFPIEKGSVGSIDFNEELLTQVFTPYQGKIIGLFAKVGDEVQKGQLLFTIDSPDLLQACSNLIAAAGVLQFTSRNLTRLKMLYETRAISQKELEQAVSDQQTAEGALRAARDAVRIFGKTDAEMDRMIAERHVDPTLVVPSPISGRITTRNAAPGLLVQPGNPPAPYTVADVSTMWMLANVAESDSPAFSVGQEVKVSVMAFPNRTFEGRISTVSSSVDPNTHRLLMRSEVADPKHELRAGHVRHLRDPDRRAGALPRDPAGWRGARGRRHDDGLGHRRSPPLHQAHGQGRPRARRLQPDSRRRPARRPGRHRRRPVPEQRHHDRGALRLIRVGTAPPSLAHRHMET